MQNRVFFPQEALDQWLVDGAIDLGGNEVTMLTSQRKYRIAEAVRILAEVSGKEDPNDLVGRVKSKRSLLDLGAEVMQGSMIIGENAYDVVEGWLGEPSVPWEQRHNAQADFQQDEPKTDEALLARFILKHS